MKQDETKETVTTIETVLKGNDLKQFKSAVKAWESMPKNAMALLHKMSTVGKALNTLYYQGIEAGLKRDVITVMARKAFAGLERRERSDYRKIAVNETAIKLFVEHEGVKSANPTYLVNAWMKAVKEDCAACELIELERRGGVDAQGNLNNPEGTILRKSEGDEDKLEVSEQTVKQGFDNVVTPEPLSAKEITVQLGFIINQVKIAYNTGKFDKDKESLETIEGHLTSCIQHINGVEGEEKIEATG